VAEAGELALSGMARKILRRFGADLGAGKARGWRNGPLFALETPRVDE
jgi:hypothetical protein